MEVEKRGFFSRSSSQANLSHLRVLTKGKKIFTVQQLQEFTRVCSSDKGDQIHYHCASSISGDTEYGTKAPSVVARLMGLDSLPTKNMTEPCFNPFIESLSFRDSSYVRYAPGLQSEHDIVIFESVRNKLDGLTTNPLDMRLQKLHNRPIEKFQTEVLPPKSAKPISVTQHPLLSPIKSPGFIPSKNAAYIIEAAAKIIEQSPRAAVKGKLPSLGSSYVPLRVQDLKEKMESAEKSSSQMCKERKSIKNMKKRRNINNQVQSADSYLYTGFEESKRVSSQRLKSKENSVSLAVQAKPTVQKRDGLISVDNRSCVKQKEHSDIKPSCVSRNIPNTRKKVENRSSSRKSSDVLRLNHQKQNCAFSKDGENFEPSSSHRKDRKMCSLSANHIPGRANRTVDKIVVNNVVTSRKTNAMATDTGKELSSSRAKMTSKKKLHINGNNKSDEKSLRCNAAFEGHCEWDKIDKKNTLDVVSFTFTSPIKKSGARSNSCGTISEMNRSLFPNSDPFVRESDSRNPAVPSSEFNAIGGDSLSVFLETKLKELTSRIELSQQDLSEEGSFSGSANSYGNTDPIISFSNSLPINPDIFRGRQEIQNGSYCPSLDKRGIKTKKIMSYYSKFVSLDYYKLGTVVTNENSLTGLEHTEEDGDNRNIDYQRYNHLHGSRSISNQPSLSEASYDSIDVDRNLSNEGDVQCLSLESNEGTDSISTRKSHTAEDCDVELSDNVTSSLYTPDSNDSTSWELQYIRDILHNADLMFEEFALGLAYNVIAPEIFHRLEKNRQMESNKFTGEQLKLERKVLFDCVCECMEVRCHRLLAGSKVSAKQATLLHERQWLAEQVYREISSWTNSEEVMADEVVDKDMSRTNGKWVDFEIEAFEEAVEIENGILTSLVDELIDDFCSEVVNVFCSFKGYPQANRRNIMKQMSSTSCPYNFPEDHWEMEHGIAENLDA
ncbi:hypothetical protein DH2020_045185 [Rehmannia glutinosa]|uniref:DUF4378 domain-containing protein n=1 Tax=Rehmannia glutinosa TaxID=99300 RepID=A0ABR0UFL9_REHGL